MVLALGAQTTVAPGSFGFSNGVHPTFSVVLEGTDERYVEDYWRNELKKVSHDVSNKKEVIGMGALLPQVSPDTVRVLVKADHRKGSPIVTAHVAILTTQGYIGPDSEANVFEAAKAFVQGHSTAIRRELAAKALGDAEKVLSRLRTDLAQLQREKERAIGTSERSTQRAAEAVDEQASARADAEDLARRIEAHRAASAEAPGEDDAKELNGLLKDRSRAEDKERRAAQTESSMKKKVEDLAWEIKKNEDDQVRKAAEIERQEAAVAELRDKLAAIH